MSESLVYIVDLIGQYFDAGVEEIMFSGVLTKKENFDRINADVLSAFVWSENVPSRSCGRG
ncbi:MAG: hypothetical protein OXT64_08710 [Gammaproteobacteria bacterium]|nr:hypothetical protein [Gammaproteobacteria bacterium]